MLQRAHYQPRHVGPISAIPARINPLWWNGIHTAILPLRGGVLRDMVTGMVGVAATPRDVALHEQGRAHYGTNISELAVSFPRLCDLQVFSRIVRMKTFGSGNRTISTGTSSITGAKTGGAQWRITSGNEFELLKSNIASMATSSGSGISVTPPGSNWFNGGVTYDGATVRFYANGRPCGSTINTQTFTQDGTGQIFAGANSVSENADGVLIMHVEWRRALSEMEMISLTLDPWQVFMQNTRYPWGLVSTFNAAWARNANTMLGAGAP